MTPDVQASREWWAQRWLDLDSYRFKSVLERARNYASGNILSISLKDLRFWLMSRYGTTLSSLAIAWAVYWGAVGLCDWNHVPAGDLCKAASRGNAAILKKCLRRMVCLISLHSVGNRSKCSPIKPTLPSTSGRFTISWAITLVKIPLFCISVTRRTKDQIVLPSRDYA